MSDQRKRACYFVDANEGCLLEAYPALLVDACVARYNAVKQLRQGSRYEGAGSAVVKIFFPLEVYFIPRSHERYPAAVCEAHAIHWMLTLDPYNASIYYYYRFRLQDAGYSEAQLESAPRPQETVCLHMMANAVTTCMGKVHRARRVGDELQWFYCSDCAWVYPPAVGVTRHHLRDEGLFLLPIE